MSTFEGAGKEAGLEVWRIEDFEAVPYEKSKYGKFHTGDSYIVLKTNSRGSSGKLSWDVHFWLGSETSQDESGAAAIKTVELDDLLGGVPVQHREVQEHESPLFESYFKAKGIKYLPGGVKSGFRHVDPEDVQKRLFQVKGKRLIKVKEVELTSASLNKDDCFILDLGKGHDILVYMPPGAHRMEKFKATQAANEIRDEDHAGNAEVVIIDQFSDQHARFFEELGSGSPDDELPASTEDDVEAEQAANRSVTLYKVSDAGGEMEVTEVATKPLKKEALDQNDCFILDTGSTTGVFAWIGKGANREERAHAVKAAEGFLRKRGLPNWTRVERVVDGGEPSVFKQYFSSWKEEEEGEDSPNFGVGGRTYPKEVVATWDVGSLHAENRRRLARSAGAAIGFMPDNSKGQKEIFRIENMEPVALDESLHGMFFAGDSYIIRYTYQNEQGRIGYILYFWQGGQSSQDEKAASAIHTIHFDDELGGKAVQVRVVQGREPRHFIKMFGGKMVVFAGGKASGFKNVHDRDCYDEDGTRLFRVRGTCADDVRAVQVEETAASLNSEDVFVLETKGNTWIWAGRGSSDDEKEIAVGVASFVAPGQDATPLPEGEEPDEFWAALGGKGDYSTEIDLDKPILDPRLFHCRQMPNGSLRAKEINHFEQGDLVEDDVMILDSGAEIYVWVGKDADQDEKAKAQDMAKEYLRRDPTDRNESNTLIFTVKQGQEPASFTCVFQSFTPYEE